MGSAGDDGLAEPAPCSIRPPRQQPRAEEEAGGARSPRCWPPATCGGRNLLRRVGRLYGSWPAVQCVSPHLAEPAPVCKRGRPATLMVRPRLWSRFKQGRRPRPDGSHSVPITVPPLSVSPSARLPEGAGQFSREPIQANGWFKSDRTRRLVGALRRKPVHEAPRTPNGLSHSVLQGTSLSRTQGLGLTSPWPGARACQAGSQAAGNLQHVNLGELCPWMGVRGGRGVCPSTSKLAADGRRVREQAQVQRTKFPGKSRSLELPEHSQNRQQWGIQAADNSQGHRAAELRQPAVW